ncbi:MAG: U3 small nucleolar RNA-associated protein [Cirrosporium novae-zelandiae]|nr:MAG: U3 small nucleolar RNA-associated protein [Cirrosporium novae-zelandiae]
MDIHRCRFVPYPPPAINALAFTPNSNKKNSSNHAESPRLAIGRANGDIEIWNPLHGKWVHEVTFRGGKDRSIEGLVWTQEPDERDHDGNIIPGRLRLFSTGYSTTVTEWDLQTGKPARNSSGSFGAIWCLAAQPKSALSKNEKEGPSQLAVGCSDGAIVILSTANEDLQFSHRLAPPPFKKARALSLCFQTPEILIGGYSDSAIRIFNIKTRQFIRNVSLGAGPKGGPKETLVWTVKCFADGTIVSGDSTGEVRFWDGKNYTLKQRIHSHKADVLCLTMNKGGNTLVSGGMDRRTTVYRKMVASRSKNRKWAEVSHRRFHENDVRALATLEWDEISVVVSGGLDTRPIVMPLREFGKEYQRPLSNLPLKTQVCSAPRKRLVAVWWDREIHIWCIPRTPKEQLEASMIDDIARGRNHKLVAKIFLKDEENLTSVSISLDGEFLAAATVLGVKLFRLRPRTDEKKNLLRVQPVDCPAQLGSTGAKEVTWSPDAQWLSIVRLDNFIQMFKLFKDESDLTTQRIFPKHITLKTLDQDELGKKHQATIMGNYLDTITHITFSANSKILVAGHLSGCLESWLLTGVEDTSSNGNKDASNMSSQHLEDSPFDDSSEEDDHPQSIHGQCWIRNPSGTLPKLPSAPLILSFRPSILKDETTSTDGNPSDDITPFSPDKTRQRLLTGEDRLLVVTSENHLYEFEVLQSRLSAWSRRNTPSNLPQHYSVILDRAMGCIWDVSSGRERAWLYGSTWIWMFDLSQDLQPADRSAKVPAAHGKTPKNSKKRKLEEVNSADYSHGTSGAGGRKVDTEMEIGRRIKKTQGLHKSKSQWISLDTQLRPHVDDDDLLDLNETDLTQYEEQEDDDDADQVITCDDETHQLTLKALSKRDVRRQRPWQSWWNTFKYRPIMGLVKIGSPQDMEIVLIERPLWEVDLPPRYDDGREWEKQPIY